MIESIKYNSDQDRILQSQEQAARKPLEYLRGEELRNDSQVFSLYTILLLYIM